MQYSSVDSINQYCLQSVTCCHSELTLDFTILGWLLNCFVAGVPLCLWDPTHHRPVYIIDINSQKLSNISCVLGIPRHSFRCNTYLTKCCLVQMHMFIECPDWNEEPLQMIMQPEIRTMFLVTLFWLLCLFGSVYISYICCQTLVPTSLYTPYLYNCICFW